MVAVSLILNFGILFYYKYALFAIETVQEALLKFGVNLEINEPDILLPVGISFYIF